MARPDARQTQGFLQKSGVLLHRCYQEYWQRIKTSKTTDVHFGFHPSSGLETFPLIEPSALQNLNTASEHGSLAEELVLMSRKKSEISARQV
jgi:hypothetical protein